MAVFVVGVVVPPSVEDFVEGIFMGLEDGLLWPLHLSLLLIPLPLRCRLEVVFLSKIESVLQLALFLPIKLLQILSGPFGDLHCFKKRSKPLPEERGTLGLDFLLSDEGLFFDGDVTLVVGNHG